MMPDWLAAVIAYLQADPDVTALCPAAAIRQTPPNDLGAPTYAVSVQRSGGYGARATVPLMDTRVDVRCYGPTPYESVRLWRAVHAALEGDRQANGFTAAGCRVLNITLSSAPIDDLVDESWPLTIASYEMLVSEVMVA